MTFTCPLCRTEWIVYKHLCYNCDRIRHLMEIYSRDKCIEILEENLVVKTHKPEKEEKEEKEEKIIKTRNQKKISDKLL